MPGQICTLNNDYRNVCSGDFGSPVFSNATGSLRYVGVVSYFPDYRTNAPCEDGHHAVLTQVGYYTSFFNGLPKGPRGPGGSSSSSSSSSSSEENKS